MGAAKLDEEFDSSEINRRTLKFRAQMGAAKTTLEGGVMAIAKSYPYQDDYGPRSPGDAPQAEEGEDDEEIDQLFKMGKKKKKGEKSAAEIALLVENVMAELEVVAEEDADLNRQSKPAINKLKKLPLLTEVLSK
ncbi:hypothetical protein U1Q18_019059 [Sarracenia purpurea var. burkii]